MQILLADAKLMHTECALLPMEQPLCQDVAQNIALEMAQRDVDDLARDFKCSRSVAAEAWQRFNNFFCANKIPALYAYNGNAYKHLRAQTFTAEEREFAQSHLWITSFLYGLLRPMDGIAPYRMEPSVRLDQTEGKPLHALWRERLTDMLIQQVQADDGILLHLSTAEYEQLFDWSRIRKSVQVVQPLFYVRNGDKLKVQAVWAKACRGAMVRYVVENRISYPESLQGFQYEGFAWAPDLGETDFPHFVRE